MQHGNARFLRHEARQDHEYTRKKVFSLSQPPVTMTLTTTAMQHGGLLTKGVYG